MHKQASQFAYETHNTYNLGRDLDAHSDADTNVIFGYENLSHQHFSLKILLKFMLWNLGSDDERWVNACHFLLLPEL